MRAALVAGFGITVFALTIVVQALRPALDGSPTDSSATTHLTVVRVDVIASDARGRAVENLKPAEFELSEDGVPQSIESVRFTKADGKAPAEPDVTPIRSEFDEQEQAGRDGTRLFAILLDEYHVSAGASTARARATLTHFVDRHLGPRDLVAVMKPLDSLSTIRMTRDRDEVRHAIDTFQGRRGEYDPRNAFERNFIAGTPAGIEQLRTQVATSALNALVVHLGKLNDGRKSVVLVSEGLASSVRRRGLETLPTIDAVIRAANRYNVSIYPVDPQDRPPDERAPRGAPGAKDIETLRTLADRTDGQAIVDAANLDGGLQQVAADSSAYYLLTYESAHPADGKFREVQVRVKRPGVRVRARKGYWALWPDEVFVSEMLARGNAPPLSRFPPGFDVARRTSPLIQPWLGISRGDAGKVRVTFVWEPASRVPGNRARASTPSRIVLKALGQDGTPAFDGAVLPASGSRVAGQEDGIAARAVFDVPPGRLRLVMSIQDATAQQIDSDVRDVSVRDLKGPVALGTAEVVRTRNAREFQQLGADARAVPVASREFSRTERLIVRVPAYAPSGAPRVTARLLSRMGQAMRDLPVAPPAAPGGLFQLDVLLAGLPPGEYYLELSASSPAGDAKDLLGFRVTN
jgi:VWFA-related protein